MPEAYYGIFCRVFLRMKRPLSYSEKSIGCFVRLCGLLPSLIAIGLGPQQRRYEKPIKPKLHCVVT